MMVSSPCVFDKKQKCRASSLHLMLNAFQQTVIDYFFFLQISLTHSSPFLQTDHPSLLLYKLSSLQFPCLMISSCVHTAQQSVSVVYRLANVTNSILFVPFCKWMRHKLRCTFHLYLYLLLIPFSKLSINRFGKQKFGTS